MEIFKVKKISAGTVYKLFAIGLTVGLLPLLIFMGVFGIGSFTWNGQQVSGIKAILFSPLMTVFMSFVFTLIIGSITVFGLWIFSLFKHINIKFVESEE